MIVERVAGRVRMPAPSTTVELAGLGALATGVLLVLGLGAMFLVLGVLLLLLAWGIDGSRDRWPSLRRSGEAVGGRVRPEHSGPHPPPMPVASDAGESAYVAAVARIAAEQREGY